MSREVIRTIETARFKVEVFVKPEDTDPADTVAFGNDPEARQAERDYLERIYSGDLPWVSIGATVSVPFGPQWSAHMRAVLGRAYLGGCDFLPFDGSEYGNQTGRDLIREAISDARATLNQSCSSLNRRGEP